MAFTKEQQDRAWQSLPKFTRDDILGSYKEICNGWSDGYDMCFRVYLEETWGRHNLTSDVEPEEMLMAPAEKVRKYYNDVVRAIGEENGDFHIEMEGRRFALEYVFGKEALRNTKEPQDGIFNVGDKVEHVNIPGVFVVEKVENETIANRFQLIHCIISRVEGGDQKVVKVAPREIRHYIIPKDGQIFHLGDVVKIKAIGSKGKILEPYREGHGYGVVIIDGDEGNYVECQPSGLEMYSIPEAMPFIVGTKVKFKYKDNGAVCIITDIEPSDEEVGCYVAQLRKGDEVLGYYPIDVLELCAEEKMKR